MSTHELPEEPPIFSLSHVLLDAAADLQTRIDLGEFDDLDEPQMTDLRGLAMAMASWGAQARLLEQRAGVTSDPAATGTGREGPLATSRN